LRRPLRPPLFPYTTLFRSVLEPQLRGLLTGQREGDGDGLVLAILVDVIVHAQLVRGQRRLVLPAVGQDVVALVGAALVVQGLERDRKSTRLNSSHVKISYA